MSQFLFSATLGLKRSSSIMRVWRWGRGGGAGGGKEEAKLTAIQSDIRIKFRVGRCGAVEAEWAGIQAWGRMKRKLHEQESQTLIYIHHSFTAKIKPTQNRQAEHTPRSSTRLPTVGNHFSQALWCNIEMNGKLVTRTQRWSSCSNCAQLAQVKMQY